MSEYFELYVILKKHQSHWQSQILHFEGVETTFIEYNNTE